MGKNEIEKKVCVVLAMHGAPPIGYPPQDIMELMGLHQRLHTASGEEKDRLRLRHDELEENVRRWPRTPKNDPFHSASLTMAGDLAKELGTDVFLGYNEFCAPAIEEAVAQAVSQGMRKIVVITPMMTPGGEHAEKDIPAALNKARERFPDIEILYAWPFPREDVAGFLSSQIRRFL